MRSKAAAIALAVAFSTTLTSAAVFLPQEASAQSRRGYDMFYDDLAQDGRWVDHPRYGWVWYPTQVRSDWRPYSDGRWVWTDRYGWYWETNERFGWATYHYGRWGYDDQYGHIWVPGDEWAPAWVSFRDSDQAIGWAPLPPETLGMTLIALLAGGRSSSHYRYVDMSDSYYQPRWTFVPTRYFTDDRVYTHAYSWRDNDRYYRGSRNVTNYITVNNYYVNRSIDPRRWESRTGRQLDRIEVREVNDRREWSNDRRGDNQLRVYNPRIERDRDGRSAPPPSVRASASDKPVVQVQRDWAAPEERRDRPNTRDEWRQRYSQGDRDDKGRAGNDRDGTDANRSGNDRDDKSRDGKGRDGNDRDRDGRDRDGRPTTATPGGATPATPATRATPADPGVNPATRATPATPATPPSRAQDRERDRNDRAQQQRAEQERAQQERAQQERAEKQREQQEKIQQQRAEQQKAAQERAQQQQEKIQQQRSQQQDRIQQQQQRQQQEKVQQQQKAAQEKAERARQPEQAAKPERQPEQRQQPQRGKQEQRGGNECAPNQPNCR